jgi:hypothetical protein
MILMKKKKLKNLYKLHPADKLSLAMRRESVSLRNGVNVEVARARSIVQSLITGNEAGVSSEEEQQEEPTEQKSLRSVMGVINEPVAHSDGSWRNMRLAQEPVTPWPRHPRPWKENDVKWLPCSK